MIVSDYFYICHYCVDYKTINLSDMIRHFKRKNKCKCKTLFSFEESITLSKKKKYKFNIDINNLSPDDFIYIITHYNEQINEINNKFRNNSFLKEHNNPNIIDILNIINEYNNKKSENMLITNLDNNEIDKKEINKNTLVPVKIDGYRYKDMYTNIYQNTINNHYYCGNCNKEYSNINSLRRHLISNACIKNQEASLIIKKNQEFCDKIIEKEHKKQEIINQQINYNNCNIQNNNNNNSNTHNSTYNLSIRDFVHDKYDLSHIKDEYYLQKDFFLYHNLLKTIMENKNNQNVFFSDDEAIIYTDNELNKLSDDKAGYMILEKISQSFDELFYNNDENTQKYYEFIQNYYRIMKGQYVNDTIYKEYDINQQKFIYTANSRLFRSRDKYLVKMKSTLNPIKNDVREQMCVSLDQIKDIQMINPNIENFVSTKMRYRDLKNKDGF